MRRHIHANGVDRHTIRHLLQRIFIPCSCTKILGEKNSDRRCPSHEVALPIEETVQALDITQETIETLLCYLELHSKRFITVLSSVYVRARVSSYNGPEALKRAAQSVRFHLEMFGKPCKVFDADMNDWMIERSSLAERIILQTAFSFFSLRHSRWQ